MNYPKISAIRVEMREIIITYPKSQKNFVTLHPKISIIERESLKKRMVVINLSVLHIHKSELMEITANFHATPHNSQWIK